MRTNWCSSPTRIREGGLAKYLVNPYKSSNPGLRTLELQDEACPQISPCILANISHALMLFRGAITNHTKSIQE